MRENNQPRDSKWFRKILSVKNMMWTSPFNQFNVGQCGKMDGEGERDGFSAETRRLSTLF